MTDGSGSDCQLEGFQDPSFVTWVEKGVDIGFSFQKVKGLVSNTLSLNSYK